VFLKKALGIRRQDRSWSGGCFGASPPICRAHTAPHKCQRITTSHSQQTPFSLVIYRHFGVTDKLSIRQNIKAKLFISSEPASFLSSAMLRRVAHVRSDVSEELSASFIRVTRIGELGTTLAVTSDRRTLRRNTRATRSNIPEDTILHSLRRQTLKSYTISFLYRSLFKFEHVPPKRPCLKHCAQLYTRKFFP
jgi:hypothetical protein